MGAAAAMLAAACSAVPPATTGSAPGAPTPAPTPTPAPPSVSVTPADGSSGVGLDQPITVTATSGTISSVAVTEDGTGTPLQGTMSSQGNVWSYTGGLALDATYSVTAVAANSVGSQVTASATFHTIPTAKRLLTTLEYISPGQTVGVGMPIDLSFNTPIPAAQRAGIIGHIAVTSTPPQPGGWYWVDAQDVHYRPENYWQPGTRVTIDAELNGVDAGNGYWGLGSWSESFVVGAAHFTLVNVTTRTLQVYDGNPQSGGRLLYTWATNLGKPGFETINGTLVVLYHDPVVRMESCPTFQTASACTPGGANYYNENVYDDTAVSTDGYFIHAAPWVCGTNDLTCDLWPYGSTNSSHGCINLSVDHAQIYYGWSQVGDVVEVSGSPKEASYSDGEGDWQTPWSSYVPGGQDVSPSSAAPSPGATTAAPASSASPPATAGRP